MSVTDPTVRNVRENFEDRVPRTAEEFEERWRASANYAQLKVAIEEHKKIGEYQKDSEMNCFKGIRSVEKASVTRNHLPYTLNLAMQFATTCRRATQRIRGEYAYFLAITTIMLVIPLVIGSMFFDIDPGTNGFFSKGGVILFMVMFNIIVNFAEVVAQFFQDKLSKRTIPMACTIRSSMLSQTWSLNIPSRS